MLSLLFVLIVVSGYGYWLVNVAAPQAAADLKNGQALGNHFLHTGQFADSFGLLNVVFSGLAFVMLALTLILQRSDLEASLFEIRKSVAAQEELAQHTRAEVQLQRDRELREREHASLQANMASLVELWGCLGKKPSLLRFHGVTLDQLKEVGIDDAEELAYLIASFEAAGVYYHYFEQDTEPFPEGSLRSKMCASEATRTAWPLLRQFFTGDSNYLAKIEATMKLFGWPGKGTNVQAQPVTRESACPHCGKTILGLRPQTGPNQALQQTGPA